MNAKSPEFYRLDALAFFDELSATEQLYRAFAGDVALGIMNMGAALHTDVAPAAVGVNRDEDISQYRLYVSPEKMAEFTREQRAGVIWHELNHVLHEHLDEGAQQDMPNGKLREMAEEIVCNDTPLHFGIDLPHNDPDGETIIYTGERFLGHNTYPATTQEVYHMLQLGLERGNEDIKKALHDDADVPCPAHSPAATAQEGEDGGSSGAGSCPARPSELSEEERHEAFEALVEGMGEQDSEDSWASKVSERYGKELGGDTPVDGLGYAEEDIVPERWAEFLRKVNPLIDIARANDYGMYNARRVAEDWRRIPLFMHSFDMSRHRLPGSRPHSDFHDSGNMARPTVVVAVDQSGSIGSTLARRVLKLAMAIPADIANVLLVPYADRAELLDLRGKDEEELKAELKRVKLGTGTSFNRVYDAVEGYGVDMGNTTVINFTDGKDNFRVDLLHRVADWVMVDVRTKGEESIPFRSVLKNWNRYIPKEQRFAIQECAPDF